MLTAEQREAIRYALAPVDAAATEQRERYMAVQQTDEMESALSQYVSLLECRDTLRALYEDEMEAANFYEWAAARKKPYRCKHPDKYNAGNVGRTKAISRWQCPHCGTNWLVNDATHQTVLITIWGHDIRGPLWGK